MDNDTALELVKKGATFLFLDVPQNTLFGIDTQMFSVGPIFKGIKMIPPGPHFVYYSSSNRDSTVFSPMIGFFVDVLPSEVVVRKWDQKEERLIKISEEEEERYSVAVKQLQFDHELGPYDLNQLASWKRLSNYITKGTIQRIEPIGGEISISCESELVDSAPKTEIEKALANQLKGSKFSKPSENLKEHGCYYTSIPRVVKHKGICGQELTFLNLDKTQLLERLLLKDYGGEEDLLLGELQFTFITFLMGQSLEGFLQWKSLINLLFSCTEAPFHARSRLFTKFLQLIYYQLSFTLQKGPSNKAAKGETSLILDDSLLSKDSFLYLLCKDFFLLVQEASVVDGSLLSWTRQLQELLESTLGWEFKNTIVDGIFDEDDEYAPVVEMLDDTSILEAA